MVSRCVGYDDVCAPVPTAPPRATSSTPRAPGAEARATSASARTRPAEPAAASRSLDWMRVDQPSHKLQVSPFATLLAQLEHRVFFLRPNALPTSIVDLERCGLPAEIAQSLRSVVAEGFSETDVVHAFLEALGPFADRARQSRQLRRALRRQFRDPGERAELRRQVGSVVVASA